MIQSVFTVRTKDYYLNKICDLKAYIIVLERRIKLWFKFREILYGLEDSEFKVECLKELFQEEDKEE